MSFTITTAAAASLSAALLLSGGITTATASSGAPAASTEVAASDACSPRQLVLDGWLTLPAELRSDLIAVRELPRGERAEAIREIGEDARDGLYGDEVQAGAERLRAFRTEGWSAIPDELRADLLEVRAAEPGERRDLVDQIVENALDGDYGDQAQATAERIRESEFWQSCVAD